jgi:hypothetical protein
VELVNESPIRVNEGAFLEDDVAGEVIGYFHFPDEIGDDKGGRAGNTSATMDENGFAADNGIVYPLAGKGEEGINGFKRGVLNIQDMALNKDRIKGRFFFIYLKDAVDMML